MKKLLLFFALMMALLVGCQNSEKVEKKEPEKAPAQEEKKEEKEEAALKNIEGEWSWNKAETESALVISNQSNKSFDFMLNVSSGGHVGEVSGAAEISGNTATFKQELDEPIFPESGTACELTFTINEDMINVKETANCQYFHGMAVSFEGDYYVKAEQEAPATIEPEEKESEVFSVKDSKYYVYGITLGDDISAVINELGNPIQEGVDDSGFSDKILEYENISVSIYQNKVSSLYLKVAKNEFIDSFRKLQENMYVNESAGIIYFYRSETEHLIFGKEDSGEHIVYLNYADGNFKYWLDEGSITQVTY